jgi:CubicO group peptidase (beta-lactamase class C family)
MRRRKIILKSFLILLLAIFAYGFWYAWRAFPLISGFGAKNVCSAVFLQKRDAATVIREELGSFPLSLGSFTVDEKDSSVTGSVWGFAKRKAIYRTGLGSTLVNDVSEGAIRAQQFNLPPGPVINRDSIAWPAGDRLIDSISPGINIAELNKKVLSLLQEKIDGEPVHTRAALVVYDGQIVSEVYAPGYDKNSVMLGWSMSKSLTSALIGVLVKEGRLDIDQPAPVPEWKNTDRQKITIRHLLQQSSGIDFDEIYSSPSEVTRMLFNKGDMAAYTATRQLKHEPGTVFNYSSGNSNILSRIIRHTVGESNYAMFPYQSLFYKIGMYSLVLEPDASGTFIGSSYSYATARDFARFGLLYHNHGRWNGDQLLPADWVRKSIEPAPANKRKNYGFQFWLNGQSVDDPSVRWYPDAPADMFFADGFGGQNIYIIPSKKLVIVRLGLRNINENKFLREVLSTIQ